MAEIALELLSDPNGNLMSLKELQEMCNDPAEDVSQLAMLSSMAVFKDLIPGYISYLRLYCQVQTIESSLLQILQHVCW
jgi:hypothetical protein